MPGCASEIADAELAISSGRFAPLYAGGYDLSRLGGRRMSALHRPKACQEGKRSLARPSDHPGAKPPLQHRPIDAAATMTLAIQTMGACGLMGEPTSAYDLQVRHAASPRLRARRPEGAR